jgi:serine/threonine-protein kinase ATR
VDLSEFLPPVQAALSISPLKTMKSKKGSREFFPRIVPRMRAFSSRVAVMASKARPKKLKAFAVPGTWKHANSNEKSSATDGMGSASPMDCDVGEIHFLVKQEAKGDLRKDARVQDLNNVINRLMTSSNNSSNPRSSRTRRLCVRTFAVTCLSEDTGILEWVPDTDSLRNAIVQSYNPQTSPLCPRRRGSRAANFGDAALRTAFERCQNMFYKNGDIVQAAKMFEMLCLRAYPPVLYWWFVQNFHDPHSWYEARVRFTLSAAAWSAIGHVIGLGDRHSENILMDTMTGGLLHVDFDWYVPTQYMRDVPCNMQSMALP